ncbi:hypothetical protein BST61_g5866 [Cercospora zeina]
MMPVIPTAVPNCLVPFYGGLVIFSPLLLYFWIFSLRIRSDIDRRHPTVQRLTPRLRTCLLNLALSVCLNQYHFGEMLTGINTFVAVALAFIESIYRPLDLIYAREE